MQGDGKQREKGKTIKEGDRKKDKREGTEKIKAEDERVRKKPLREKQNLLRQEGEARDKKVEGN